MRQRILLGIAIGLLVALFGSEAARKHVQAQPPAVQELVGELKDPNLRRQALIRISSQRPFPEAITPHVIGLLNDPDFNTRSLAADTLGSLQNAWNDLPTRFPKAVRELIRLLSDRDQEDRHQIVRLSAVRALRSFGPAAKDAVPEFLKIAKNENELASVKTDAVWALGDIGHASHEVVATLIGLLDDKSRINVNYPTIGHAAHHALARLGTKAEAARPVLLQRLRLARADDRKATIAALGSVGAGSLDVEKELLALLNDQDSEVQKLALSALEGINESNAYFFRNNVSSREVSEKQNALLAEIGRDPARKARFTQLLAAQLRQGKTQSTKTTEALRRLVALNARDTLPLVREQFALREKKTHFLEFADLRLLLLRVLKDWLPDNEVAPFLIAVDGDVDEAPQVRFRAALLLCERGDTPSLEYVAQRYFSEADKVEPLLTVGALETALKDRRLFASDKESADFKLPAAEELIEIQKGIQLAQHFYAIQRRGAMSAIRRIEPAKIQLRDGTIESVQFSVSVPSETWRFDLRKKGDRWLPSNFSMRSIE